MATYEQAEQWLQGLTAMPGWRFELDRHDSLMRGIVVLIITHETANADGGGATVTIGSRSPVPLTALPDREAFYQWVWGEIHERLGHELLEWMRADGRRIFDPHPDSKLGWTAYRPTHYLLGERVAAQVQRTPAHDLPKGALF